MNDAASAHSDFGATLARSIRGVDQTVGTMMQNSIHSDVPFPFLSLPLEIQMRIAQIYIGTPRIKVHLGGRYPPRLTYTRLVDISEQDAYTMRQTAIKDGPKKRCVPRWKDSDCVHETPLSKGWVCWKGYPQAQRSLLLLP
jgi:hypothetical protein